MRLRHSALVLLAWLSSPGVAYAFPPYRSTDADTAEPWMLEGRLGLLRIEHAAGDYETTSPLVRLNLGLPQDIELVSELEYLPDERRLGDAAAGVKWVPLKDVASLGVEALVLLPVTGAGGSGVETSLLATFRAAERLRVHVNAGGFYDARSKPAEWGLRAGSIGELRLDGLRPGVEVFAKRPFGGSLQVLAGPGLIIDLGPVDARSGAQIGLTSAAPDLTLSFWVTGAFPLAR